MLESPVVVDGTLHRQNKVASANATTYKMPSKGTPKLGQIVVQTMRPGDNATIGVGDKWPQNYFISDSSYLQRNNKQNANIQDDEKENTVSNDLPPSYDEVADDDAKSILTRIAMQIEEQLKEAKRTHLACGEVLVPCNLTRQIAHDVLTMSDSEPCGLRGGIIYMQLEGSGSQPLRTLGVVKMGARGQVPTFEMFLNLKRSGNSWLNVLGNLFNRNSIVLSDCYQLSKKKLYRSDS